MKPLALLAVLLFYPPQVLPLQQQQIEKTVRHNNDSGTPNNPPQTTIINVEEGKPLESPATKEKNSNDHEKPPWEFILNFVMALATIALAIYAAIQAKASKVAAEAAKLNAQALINSERAWVHTEFVPASTVPDPPYIFRVSNYGRTPADIISYKIECFSLAGTNQTSESSKSQDSIHMLLARDSSKDFDSISPAEAFSLSWNEVRVGRKDNRIKVSVEYFDILNRKVTHVTEMVYTYNFPWKNIINLPILTKYT